MTFLILAVSTKYYALPVIHVQEVLPNLLDNDKQSGLPDYLAGTVNYYGEKVNVVDLCQVHENRFVRNVLSSRIILVNYQLSTKVNELIGLLAEQVTDTIQLEDKVEYSQNYSDPTFQVNHPSITDGAAIQLFNFNKMIPQSIEKIFSL